VKASSVLVAFWYSVRGYEYIEGLRYDLTVTWNSCGASVFGRLRFIPQAYLHAEFACANYTEVAAGNRSRFERRPGRPGPAFGSPATILLENT
jgi:hypothetical protein